MTARPPKGYRTGAHAHDPRAPGVWYPQRRRANPAALERCVSKVQARNHRAQKRGRKVARKPYAVCAAALKKTARRRPRKNPARQHWYIHVQRGRGPVLLWNGHSFSNVELPHTFRNARSAKQQARTLLRAHRRKLRGYKVWVADQAMGATHRVNPERRPELDAAAKKLEDFTGREATHVERARARSTEKTGLVIGELDLIGYRAKREGVRGGRKTRYAHEFREGSRPLLAVSTDGKQLHVVGGRYEFTEAGIEDR